MFKVGYKVQLKDYVTLSDIKRAGIEFDRSFLPGFTAVVAEVYEPNQSWIRLEGLPDYWKAEWFILLEETDQTDKDERAVSLLDYLLCK